LHAPGLDEGRKEGEGARLHRRVRRVLAKDNEDGLDARDLDEAASRGVALREAGERHTALRRKVWIVGATTHGQVQRTHTSAVGDSAHVARILQEALERCNARPHARRRRKDNV